MIEQKWVIDCEYTTLQSLYHLLRLLRRWLSNTILIRLTYPKMEVVSQVYEWGMCWTRFYQKKKRKIELYLPGTVCHYVEINEKNPQHCNCNGTLKCCEKCHLYLQVLQKCECEKTVVYRLLRVDQPKFSEGIMKQGTGQLMKCHVVKTCWLWMISFLIKSEWQNFSWVQEELRNTRCEVDKTP